MRRVLGGDGVTFTTNFKHDKPTQLDERTANDRADARRWIDVCRVVDYRDKMHCRCCSRSVVRMLTKRGDRAEHHHVIPKSLGGQDTKENLCLLCLECHEWRHVKRTLHIRGNADKVLTFEADGKTWRA